ncbi:cyclic nucleotide-gated cation channel subunit a [Holotrichia oblita]|uniref:Cyclic nucleotide-gated cation channel subunit a n=2 Tax=Holotrichia oblita TaxID=644536 RepID=A0ACB9THP4_HOLOL|nr:cyclic nucleotide-gated cation channel subunit a [Holotrichia oblita]KAI4466386.1 cyclic nucleotide-gated cation channel subunit a [Holotrichia oblita]
MTHFRWLISCPHDRCEYITNIRQVELNLTSSNNSELNMRITYMYVVSIFSSTGLRNQVPRTVMELAATFCIVLVSQVMIYTLTSGFANILRLGKYVLNNYEREINHLDIFMRNANLSLPIINKVRSYFIVLWHHYSGVCMPTLISRAPGYLKQDIMFALYGYHITNHILFSKTHMDFIRQLLVHMVPEVYLPGQYVIEKGDIDGRMYFIHDGQVKILDKHGNNEIEQCVLIKGNSFGEYQALKNIEHIRSVKTAGICVIISLKTSDWSYLLDWFPASREILESKLNDTVTPGTATD